MITDAEIRAKGLKALIGTLGQVEAGRFITLALREPFDYTEWRQALFEDDTVDELHQKIIDFQNKKDTKSLVN